MDREGPRLSVSTHPADHHEVTLVQLSFEFYMIEATPGHLLGPPLTLIPPAASGPPLTFGGWNLRDPLIFPYEINKKEPFLNRRLALEEFARWRTFN